MRTVYKIDRKCIPAKVRAARVAIIDQVIFGCQAYAGVPVKKIFDPETVAEVERPYIDRRRVLLAPPPIGNAEIVIGNGGCETQLEPRPADDISRIVQADISTVIIMGRIQGIVTRVHILSRCRMQEPERPYDIVFILFVSHAQKDAYAGMSA